jgi:hypothetical protein
MGKHQERAMAEPPIRIDKEKIRARRRAAHAQQVRTVALRLGSAAFLVAGLTVLSWLLAWAWHPSSAGEGAFQVAAVAVLFGLANLTASALLPWLGPRPRGGSADAWLLQAAGALPAPVACWLVWDHLKAPVGPAGVLLWGWLAVAIVLGTWTGWWLARRWRQGTPARPVLSIRPRPAVPVVPATEGTRRSQLNVTPVRITCKVCTRPIATGAPTARCQHNPPHLIHRDCLKEARHKCPDCGRPIR